MKQYIDKAVIVAEIERLYNSEYTNDSDLSCGKKIILRYILSFLDSLGVKEVDLEKEINQYFEKTWPFEETDEDIIAFAEYFFELGLKIK